MQKAEIASAEAGGYVHVVHRKFGSETGAMRGRKGEEEKVESHGRPPH